MKSYIRHITTKLRLLISILVIGATLVACAKHDDELSPIDNGDCISFYSEIAAQKARLSTNNFEEGESIGLYVVSYQPNGYTPGVISNAAYAVNKQHVYNGTSWMLKLGGKVPWPNSPNKVDLYAYYPYSETLDTQDPTNHSFTVKANQQTKESYDASDFLWAKTGGVAPTINAVGLNFAHKLSKIKVNIKTTQDLLTNPLRNASVKILGAQQEGIINLADGSVSIENVPQSTAEITPLQVATVSGYELSFEAIVIPQTLNAGTPFIKIEIAYNDIIYTYVLTEDVALEAGKERTFNITLTEIGISVTVDSITDWEPTEPIEGEIGTLVPKVLDINTIDWSKSWVHKVYEDNIQVAEVVKEYIYYDGAIDYQAIVVYLIGLDGKPDLENGFIARVMNRARNTTTNEYEPNTSNVHGGLISFASDNSFQGYIEGNEFLFNKVEISPTLMDKMQAAPDDATVTLTTEPDVLVDVDGNTYPIVKIGTQYWMKENLKVEHYKDGSNLTYYYYYDNTAVKHTLGAYYTWATAMDTKGIAPDGWRLPTQADLYSMSAYLGGVDAGMKLKANTIWADLTNGDDVTGFSGLAAGRKAASGTYEGLSTYGQWWTATESTPLSAHRFYLFSGTKNLTMSELDNNFALSVRLIRE